MTSPVKSSILATSCLVFAAALINAQPLAVRDIAPSSDRSVLAASAVDRQSNAMYLWMVTGPTGQQLAVRSRRYTKATDTLDAPVDVVTLPAGETYVVTDLVIDSSGDATAVGIRHVFVPGQGLTSKRVQATRFSAATGQWQPFATLSPFATDIAGEPTAVVDASGHVTVVWFQKSCSGCGAHALYTARSSAGGAWDVQPIANDVSGVVSRVRLDGMGNVLVIAGRRSAGATISLDAWHYSTATGAWTSTPGPQVDTDGTWNSLALARDGRALVTWTRTMSLDAAFFNMATKAWSSVQVLSSTAVQQPSAATDQSGNAIVTWNTPGGGSAIPLFLARRYSSGSGTWSPAAQLSANGFWGDVVIGDDGVATAAWHDRSTGPNAVRAARYDPAAGVWANFIDFATTAGSFALGRLQVDAANGVRVSWTNFDATPTSGRNAQTVYWPAGTAGPPTGPPGAPTGLLATVSGHTVNLSWDTPPTGAPPTGYTLIGRLTAGGPVLGTVPMGAATSFSLAAPNGTFVLTVSASNAQGAGPESAPVVVTVPAAMTAAPGPPSNLSATASGTTANFTWNPPASGGPVEGYVFLAGASPSFSVPLASLPLGPSTAFSVGGVPPGTYWVRILARNSAGSSAASNETSITVAGLIAPGVPTMNVPAVTGQTVSLSWAPGSGGAPTSYTLLASLAAGGAPIAVAPMSGTSVSFANVPNGTYYLRVTASNAAGTSAPSADVAAVVGPPTGAALLPLVNAWRTSAGVPALTEDPGWSNGASLHSRYVIEASNSALSFEGEDPRHPAFTTAGNDAGLNGVLFYSLFNSNLPPSSIVSNWAHSPMVSLQMLDPGLQRTGLGYATVSQFNVNRTAVVFDVMRGRRATQVLATPTMFPRHGSTIVGLCAERTSYAACGVESYPPVLPSCGITGNGFTLPAFGMPVWIQFGGAVTPVVTAASLSNGTTLLPVCTVTADSYTVATAEWQTLGRKILSDRGAVILVPKVTLPAGMTYTASVTVNGQQYQWSFEVKEP